MAITRGWPELLELLAGKSFKKCASRPLPAPTSMIGWSASNEGSEEGEICEDIYSCDNRRLFMLRVLGVESVVATEVAWMGEFDSKLLQADPPATTLDMNWATSDDGVHRARKKLDEMLREELQTGSDETIQIRVPYTVCGLVIGARGTRMRTRLRTPMT